jgi:hypothetical protein
LSAYPEAAPRAGEEIPAEAHDSTAPALVLGFVTPALAIAGAVAAPIIDGTMRRR